MSVHEVFQDVFTFSLLMLTVNTSILAFGVFAKRINALVLCAVVGLSLTVVAVVALFEPETRHGYAIFMLVLSSVQFAFATWAGLVYERADLSDKNMPAQE